MTLDKRKYYSALFSLVGFLILYLFARNFQALENSKVTENCNGVYQVITAFTPIGPVKKCVSRISQFGPSVSLPD